MSETYELLEDIRALLYLIQNSWKGSIGGIDTHYLSQIEVGRVDGLTEMVDEVMEKMKGDSE